jgi:NADH-quinone oxidoreductase subunit D
MAVRHEVTLGIGSGALGLSSDPELAALGLELGAHHPTAHGGLRLHLVLDDDVVVSARPQIGLLHRGAEKLFEVRDYRQALVLANRHDWHASFGNELGIVLAVERMLGMEVPERATWARTMLAELTRVLHHLTFLGAHPLAAGATTPTYYALDEREALQQLLEEASGGRMHLMLNQVGGLKADLPDGWTSRTRAAVALVRARMPLIDAALASDELVARLRGVGVLPLDVATAYGTSGPVARASGLALDLRRDEPYLAYAELGDVLRVVAREEGDALARYEVLAEQVHVSLDLVDACLDRLDEIGAAPVNLKLPKVLRAPEGATYCWTENPSGISGYLLVSRNEKTPWRLKVRSASFNNLAALPDVLAGARLGDVVEVLASLFVTVGDADR